VNEPAPILIVKTGVTVPELVERRGDFEDWIARGLALGPDRLRVASVFSGDALPDPASLSGVVVTGSSAMVSHRETWSEESAAWLRGAVGSGLPVLGICYGHQLLAHAFGGRVGRNPRGREIGSVEVRLRDARADPLLRGLPDRAHFQATHVESVLALPRGAVLLAENEADPHHAFRLGDAAWGVQFHPEFDADVMRGYLEVRRDVLLDEGLDPDALHRSVVDTPQGAVLLRRFARIASGSAAGA
jgi:GMP synthase (glutamine-hydrolysing)